MNTKMFYAFIQKKLGIASPSTWLSYGYKYEYDWLKERRLRMITNKDTVKALNAATTLVNYCGRYKTCDNCIFHACDFELKRCFCEVNMPCTYKEVRKNEDNDRN